MAQDNGRHFARLGIELLKDREDEDGSLSHARFRLAEDIHAENSVRDALVLDCEQKERVRGAKHIYRMRCASESLAF